MVAPERTLVTVRAWWQHATSRRWSPRQVSLYREDDCEGNDCLWVEGGPIVPLYGHWRAVKDRDPWDALLMVYEHSDGLRVPGDELRRAIARLSPPLPVQVAFDLELGGATA